MDIIKRDYLYHGSDEIVKEFEPRVLDLGNAFQKPGWSIFCFDNHRSALNWAIMRKVQRYRKKMGPTYEYKDDIDCYWNTSTLNPLMTQKGFDLVVDKLVGEYVYVHIFDTSDKKVGVGHNVVHDEYTIRESIVPYKVDKVKLTRKLLSEQIQIVDSLDDMYNIMMKHESSINRGFNSLFMIHNFSDNKKVAKFLVTAVKNEELKPGDDIEKFLDDNHMKMVEVNILKRLKFAILGEINKKFDLYNLAESMTLKY